MFLKTSLSLSKEEIYRLFIALIKYISLILTELQSEDESSSLIFLIDIE